MKTGRFHPYGKPVEYLAVITMIFGLITFFEPFPAPFHLDWSDIHLTFGIVLIAAMPVHFLIMRRACDAMVRRRRG